jgi:ADP-ribosyl-[dinitrogen reductase] hydrolase
VVYSLEAALWAFEQTTIYKDALLFAVNLGGDADTIAAITGQIAGAYYGLSQILDEWLRDIQ